MKTRNIMRGLTTPILAGALLLPAFASAETVLFHDDFSGLGVNPGDSPSIPPWTDAVDEEAFNNFLRVRQDFSDYFGKGTDNQYLEFSGNDASMVLAADNVLADGPDHEVVTFSMDFYEPDRWDKQDPLIIFLYNGPIAGDTRVDRLRLTHGGTGTSAPAPESRVYQLDRVNKLDWIVNGGSETFTYLNGTRTISPGRADVWINGNLIHSDHKSFTGDSALGFIRGFDIRTFGNIPAQEIYIDKVLLTAGANVRLPEAATNPLMEFLFEGNLVNTGSLGGEGSFVHEREDDGVNDYVWQVRAGFGEGLGGRPNSALDNTVVGGMGTYNSDDTFREGGVFYHPGEGLNDLQSITVTAWVKAEEGHPWAQNAFLFSRLNAIDLFAGTSRVAFNPRLLSGVSRQETSGPNPWQQETNRWMFVAVTFDGITGAMRFYNGYQDSDGVRLDANRTTEIGPIRNLSIGVMIANSYFGSRPFKGWVDNFRVFGSTEDGTGALGVAALNNIWAGDLQDAHGPVVPVDEIIIVDFSHDGNDFSVSFETEAGVDYVVESTTDFRSWETAETITGDGEVKTFSESVSGVVRRFYRIRLAD